MSLAERLSSISQPRALRDGPLENLWAGGGGGGAGGRTTKKIPVARKVPPPPPPITFPMVRP